MIGFIALFLLAAGFVLLPLYRGSKLAAPGKAQQSVDSMAGNSPGSGLAAADARREQNRRVHAEQLAELQLLRDEGKIDAAQFEALQNELLHSVLELGAVSDELSRPPQSSSRSLLWVSLSCVVLVSIACIYSFTGYFLDTKTQAQVATFSQQASSADADNTDALLALLPSIEQRVVARPANLGWRFLLAQMQSELKRYSEAANSYQILLQTDAQNAEIWAYYAQALYLSNARRMDSEVERALDTAIALNPHQRTALGLQGMHAFETENYAQAAKSWGALLGGLPPNSEQHALISNAHNAALAKLAASDGGAEQAGQSAVSVANATVNASDVDSNESSKIVVAVSVSDQVQVADTDAVFVYARAANGPKMPLAIRRLTVADLPMNVELHDGLAMMPAMKLSMFDEIEIIARISKNGTATAQSGDWQASSGALQRSEINESLSLSIAAQL